MALRVAFDLDGVLADMDSALRGLSEELFGPSPSREAASPEGPSDGDDSTEPESPPEPVPAMQLTTRQERHLWKRVSAIENFWEGLAEIEPGSVRRIGALATEREWEVIFLTKRPRTAGATSQVQSQRWLARHGFELPSVYVVQGSRGRIAESLALDIVVDDRPENCLDIVSDSAARAVLVARASEPAAARRLGIGIVKTVAECLDLLVEIEALQNEKPSMIARVKRMLGAGRAPIGA